MTVIAKSILSNNLADLERTRDITACQLRTSFWRNVSLIEQDGATTPLPKRPATISTPLPPPASSSSYLRRCQEFLQQNAEGDTQLHVAIVQELPIMVAAMVNSVPHPGLLDVQNDDRQTPLHLAVLTRQCDVVRCLLDAGADTGKRDSHGNTALHLACQLGDIACVKELTTVKALRTNHVKALEQGIKVPNCYHKSDPTSLIDFESGFFESSQSSMLPQRPKSLSTGPVVKELEVCNFEGETCVHVAAIHGHVDVLGWLRVCGADLNAREGKSGNTALHISIERKLETVSRYLLEDCVDTLNLGTKNYAGLNVFSLAVGINPLLAGIIASIREVRGENCEGCSNVH